MMYWASLPMDRESIRMSKLIQPAYEDALKKDITKNELVPRLKITSKSVLNMILSFFGLQGSGKSYALLFLMEILAKYSGIELSIDNVCFTITDLLKIIEKGGNGEIYCLDEQRHTYGCLSGNTIISTINNGNIMLKDLNIPLWSNTNRWNNYYYKDIKTISDIGKDVARVSNIGEDFVYEVITDKNNTIECNEEHLFWVIKNNKMLLIPLKDLVVGDEIITEL